MTKYVDWDVKTITAGDYTVEFEISRSAYKYWQEHFLDETNMLSECS